MPSAPAPEPKRQILPQHGKRCPHCQEIHEWVEVLPSSPLSYFVCPGTKKRVLLRDDDMRRVRYG